MIDSVWRTAVSGMWASATKPIAPSRANAAKSPGVDPRLSGAAIIG